MSHIFNIAQCGFGHYHFTTRMNKTSKSYDVVVILLG